MAAAEMTRTTPDEQHLPNQGLATPVVVPPQPDRWAEVVLLWSELGCPYERSYSLLRHAEALLASRGPRDVADRLLQEAADAAMRLGAEALAAEVRSLRQMAGLTGGPSPSKGLTRREEEILELLGRGLSNRQIGHTLFISDKTASVHVSNLLRKLGASSRLEAAAIAHLRTREEPPNSRA